MGSPSVVAVSIKLRSVFDKPNTDLRRESLALLEVLALFGAGQAALAFKEQIHANLVCLVLHVNDENAGVRQQCRNTLVAVSPFLGSAALDTLFQNMPREEQAVIYGTFDFESFADSTCAILVESFVEHLPLHFSAVEQFFTSQWPAIRANSAVFSGFLVCHAKKNPNIHQNYVPVCHALVEMLKESSATVRRSAAFALSIL
eukprot:c19893_g1_i2.p2 GENE.c19893_g1_i2~~c19893_g1_i2.p2  ORF type:complete len:202 (+),score=53.97 c19893_g1_i2:2-607(+)